MNKPSEKRYSLDYRKRLVVDPKGFLDSNGNFIGRLEKPSPMYVNGMPGSPNLELYPNLEAAINGDNRVLRSREVTPLVLGPLSRF